MQTLLLEHLVKIGIDPDTLEIGFGPSTFDGIRRARRYYQCSLR
jgi:hypothetical protein